ncbi:hypothetical protein DFH09DRAFT_1307908 [Mycena vulgaris]|nr:hypothetical protein DFH09DRAFT_1307908 [Mycena vulgaris]
MLTTMDGNDSLKRVLKHDRKTGAQHEEEPMLEKVDEWAKARLADILPANEDPKNPCSDRWKNMINDVTSWMWGIFDETGIFLALCQHGFVLIVADMVRSGELAKYPLAVVELLLDVFGLKFAMGYDIGCHFEATVENSRMGDKACTNQFKSLVGLFHGHAHNRLCQLSFLATYVEGMGLEDLEGCERYFSRSNGLAKSNYQIISNRSTNILAEPALLRWMKKEGIDDYNIFHVWLQEERDYLLGLDAGLLKRREESLQIEYVQKLVNLSVSETRLLTIRSEERRAVADDTSFNPVPTSQVARRHAINQQNRDIDPEWVTTVKDFKNLKYQEALDDLEKLIVERLFELTKVNQSGMGYKMRKHIAKALQARSKGGKNAVERYNMAAMAMEPPMLQMT